MEKKKANAFETEHPEEEQESEEKVEKDNDFLKIKEE
jgi:hypothetical protein